jgi:hypothetical protein
MRDFIEEHFDRFYKAIEAIGGDLHKYEIDVVAEKDEIDFIESTLGISLPPGLKAFALSVSRQIEFAWYLPDGFELPDSLSGIFCGLLEYDISLIPVHEDGRKNWQNVCFPNAEDPYDVIWHNKLGFHPVPNGDYLSFDPSGRVIYLSHDDGEGHGYVMASSFSELIKKWIPLGCPGPEDWQWMPFVSDRESGILPDCDAAKKWLQIIYQNT